MRIYLFDNQEVIKFLTYVSTDITTQKEICKKIHVLSRSGHK
jgi:hypothetical protein